MRRACLPFRLFIDRVFGLFQIHPCHSSLDLFQVNVGTVHPKLSQATAMAVLAHDVDFHPLTMNQGGQ